MNQTDFFANLIEYSKDGGFAFLLEEGSDVPAKPSPAKLAFVKVASGAAFGLFGVLSSGNASKATTEDLIVDLKRMNEYCDLVGIRLNQGNVIIRMVIDADKLSNELILGRFALIHERLFDFRKYAITLLASKLPTLAQVILTFSEHKRANEFNKQFADKCKHTTFWKKVYTQPWVADLEDEEITRMRAPIDQLVIRDGEKLRAALFRKRQ